LHHVEEGQHVTGTTDGAGGIAALSATMETRILPPVGVAELISSARNAVARGRLKLSAPKKAV
jgi:hypothetical protein